MTDDPYAVLGVERGVTEVELRAARRRAALRSHPDHEGGSTERMRRVNLAFEAALDDLVGSTATTADPPRPAPQPAAPGAGRGHRPRSAGRLEHDVASFTIEALPVEAFEALLVVATWLGEIVDDEPPYRLDVVLDEPLVSWCRLELVPDAGASTVAVTVGAIDGGGTPDLDTVRDAWVAALNALGPEQPV